VVQENPSSSLYALVKTLQRKRAAWFLVSDFTPWTNRQLRCEGSTRIMMHTIHHNGRIVHLVEAPSLDSPGREEEEVFEEWAYWLIQAYKKGMRVNGLVYLHNILDPRLTHSALYGLEVFKEMCGDENYPAIVMATSRWDIVEEDKGAARAVELVENPFFWGDLRGGGSYIARLINNTVSAMEIVGHILDQERKCVLAIQREMVDEGRELHKTEAGKVLYGTWSNEKDKLERQKQGLKRELDSLAALSTQGLKDDLIQISQEIERYVARADQQKKSMEKLQKNTEELTTVWDAKVRDDLNCIRDQLARSQKYLYELEKIHHDALEGKVHPVHLRKDFETELKLMREKVNVLQRTQSNHTATYRLFVDAVTCLSGLVAVGLGCIIM
jgi:hypothetical protein